MQENIKQVIVKNTVRKEFKTAPIFQYDVGHVLSFEGFDLPEAFEVHFSLTEAGDAVAQVGSNNQVTVPDILVQDGRWLYAWLYISDQETGLTKFTIQIPVTRRARPTDQTPTPVEQSEIQQAIAALNAGVTRAETAAENAETAEENASQSAENAYNSSEAAASAAESAEGDARTATEKAQIAVNAAETATRKAQEASESAEGLAEAVRTAQEAKQTAVNKATEAAQSATNATQKAQEATSAASSASQSATDADTAKRGAESARDAAQGYAGNASTSAQAAETAKDTAVQKAGEASQSATAAAQSAQAAQQTAAQFEEDITELKSDIQANQEGLDELSDAFDEHEEYAENTYAKQDGYYADMTVGNAEQLNSSKYVENSEPYTFRTSGGSSDIGNREYVDAVVGGTVAWNQAVRDSASENSTDFASIVTVTDAVEDAAGVKVKIEPVQDLHGYDSPWPAGGGNNIWDEETEMGALDTATGEPSSSTKQLRAKNFIPVIAGNSYKFFTFNGAGKGIWVLFYDSNKEVITTGLPSIPSAINARQVDNGVTVVMPENCAYIRFYFQGYYGTTYMHDTAVCYPSTANAYSPYSNICPITGLDGVKVTRTGKNLFAGYEQRTYIKPGTLYTISSAETTGAERIHLNAYNGNGERIHPVLLQGTTNFYVSGGTTIMLAGNQSKLNAKIGLQNSDAAYIVAVDNTQTAYHYVNYNEIQLELGSTATDYEPYAGNTYDITLPTEAGTVYGGELKVNADGSGSLVVDRASIIVPQRASAVFQLTNTTRFMIYGLLYPNWYKIRENIISNMLVEKGYNTDVPSFSHGDNSANVYFKIPKSLCLTTGTEINAWLENNPIQLVYPIAEPITYTLTATQVRTLLGTNNVWADTGDLALTYTGTDEHLTLESGKKYLARLSGTDSMLLGSGQEIAAAKGTDNVFDLTQMFGTAVADYVYGQGASFFRRWFGKQWYPYNAGELLSVEGLQSHDMVGFNQWDEEWEVGRINTTTGTNTQATGIRSKNFIPVLPLTAYFMKSSRRFYVIEYDANKNYVRYAGNFMNEQYTTSANAHYIRFYNVDVTIYSGDICINLAHNGSRNGEYEPYEKHSYPLDSTVILRGIPKVGANGVYWDGDRYLPDGMVERRYKEILIDESCQWYKDADTNGYSRYYFEDDTIKRYLGYIGLIPNSKGYENANDHVFSTATNDIAVSLYNTTYNIGKNWFYIGFKTSMGINTVDALKTWLASNNFTVVVELATPTTETAQPYHSTQWVSDWGTEEFVSTGIVPVGHETRYPANLRDKLQHLPDAASGNGSYLITQTDGQMVLTPFPAPPSTAGNYVLKATVTGGVATYTWEVAT